MKDRVLEQKESVVAEITENIESAKSIVLVDYRGLNVEELTELRDRFRKENVVYKVYKNTMMDIAFKKLGHQSILEHLKGPNAVAFSMEDATAAARIANDFAKDHEKLEIKAGYIDEKFLDLDGVKELASIPSREVLIGKLLGSLKAPVSNFVYLIDAIAKKKEESGEATAEVAAE
ncbi:50S ribosomal protein L10 [Lagierella sp.]|uniref:50S ribosomal protein L10 n=1 Tax=Lagierella sp. TaxID=2849657 RepID=UPI00262774E3|nr:50S ribosomal protein L10 [Lagierella sp.]